VEKRPDPGALPALKEFLENGMNDVDTGDGILSVRGAAAEAVAELGDPRALPALERALQRSDPAVRSATSGFPAGYVFKSGTSHPAIRTAIEKLREAKPPA
jgi:HEAT repeat protein